MESRKLKILNTLSFITLLGSVFISIFAFIPYSFVPIHTTKGFIISVGVTLSVFFWLLARLVAGKFVVPKDRLILFAFFIPVAFLCSSLFSYSPYMSLFGIGFEIGTFSMMLVMFLVLFLSSIYFQSEEKVTYFFRAIWFGAGILALLEFIHIFFNIEKLSPGIIKGLIVPNFFGSWNDFALFFGFIVVFSLLTLQLKKLSKIQKISISVLLLVSLFFLALVNSFSVWVMTGVFSLLVFVYGVSFSTPKKSTEQKIENKIPLGPFVVVLLSLLFILSHNSFGTLIPNYFGLSNAEVTPSLASTMTIAKHSLMHNPIFGIGPNTFSIGWSLWRPVSVFATQFFNSDFSTGVGLIPTFLVTTGILGFLSVLLFLVVFLLRALQSIKIAIKDKNSNYIIFSSIVAAFYFWIAAMFSTPSMVCLILASMSTGVFIGVLAYKRVIAVYEGTFLQDPRASFFSILGLVTLMIVAISTVYLYTSKFMSLVYFARSQNTEETIAGLQQSERNLVKAISFNENDAYYRTLSQVYLSQLGVTLSDKTINPDSVKSKVQELVSKIEQTAGLAVTKNPKYYRNFVNMGDIYNTFMALGIESSYENAMSAYSKALEISPNDPSVLFAIGTLDYKKGSYTTAIKSLESAVAVNPSYFDARYVLALSYQKIGDTTNARAQLNLLNSVFPNNTVIKEALASVSSGTNIAPLPADKIIEQNKKLAPTKKK